MEKPAINIGEVKKQILNLLKTSNIKTYSIDSDLIISKVTGLTREKIIAYPERIINNEQYKSIVELANKRSKYYPIAYIIGEKEFYGLTFTVNENVLIPRPETEHLVEKVLSLSSEFKSLLDICTGSGIIGITVKFYKPEIDVTISDINETSLVIAGKNADKILNNTNIKIIQSDLFENITGKYDIITCNPPYISEAEYLNLQHDVLFEPKEALIALEEGYYYYYEISKIARYFLNPNGLIFYEIGDKQKEHIIEINKNNGYIFKECITDYSNKDRILVFGSH